MKRYRLLYRGIRNTYYCFDTHTDKRESLGTGNRDEAQRVIDAKNEAVQHVAMNLQIAQVYLQHSDPTLATRTWADVMNKVTSMKTGSTKERYELAIKDSAFDDIRHRKLLETSSDGFPNRHEGHDDLLAGLLLLIRDNARGQIHAVPFHRDAVGQASAQIEKKLG